MKIWKKYLVSILALSMLLGLSAVNVCAAEQETYKYTVTFHAGIQGEFQGTDGVTVNNSVCEIKHSNDKIILTNLEAGDIVSINAQAAAALDNSSKYYVQGVRQSGRDNDTVAASVFTVNEDADYVVAYGIKGNMATYTVNYQDENGNALAESQTFYGNVGDKPVVAYRYIDGYAPQAYGLTKTLSENDADNVFTFVYDRIPGPTVNVVTRPAQTTTGTTTGTTDTEDDETAIGGTTTPGTTETIADETTEDVTENVEEDVAGPEAEEEEQQPEIVDLDDEEVPLAGTDLEEEVSKGLPLVGIGATLVTAIVALGVLIMFVRKQKNYKK